MTIPATGLFDLLDNHFLVTVGVSLLCGCIVGFKHKWRGKPTGMRTCVLLCLGTALFVHLGIVLSGSGDNSRVLGQVVTGIGFLGGGVIMGRGDLIYGVTTATVVWILAATGALIGVGKYNDAVAIAVVTVLVLTVLDYVERGIQRLRRAVLSGSNKPPEPQLH